MHTHIDLTPFWNKRLLPQPKRLPSLLPGCNLYLPTGVPRK